MTKIVTSVAHEVVHLVGDGFENGLGIRKMRRDG
jgi:hypothetical protein